MNVWKIVERILRRSVGGQDNIDGVVESESFLIREGFYSNGAEINEYNFPHKVLDKINEEEETTEDWETFQSTKL